MAYLCGKFNIISRIQSPYSKYYISIDYGTSNPTSMGLWGLYNRKWYRVADSYYDGRERGPRTDEEHYQELKRLVKENIPSAQPFQAVRAVIVDPSAASFIQTIKKHGRFRTREANNDVLDGIRNTAAELNAGRLLFCDGCHDIFDEFGAYVWDSKESDKGEDKPVKSSDHAMDDMRYFVNTILYKQGGLRVGGDENRA